jgi:hypothetical protein
VAGCGRTPAPGLEGCWWAAALLLLVPLPASALLTPACLALPLPAVQRIVHIDNPDLGYGKKRVGEMDAGETFDLKIEVLQVFPKK